MPCVEYVAGWSAGNVEEPVVHAIKMLVWHFRRIGGPVSIGKASQEVAFTVNALLGAYEDKVR